MTASLRLLPGLALLLPTLCFADGHFMGLAEKGVDLYATLNTTKGDVVLRLLSKDAPKTVANFAGLASGEKQYSDPKGAKSKKPFYDGVLFHRVIPGFMIQGGDQTGSGAGSPGYTFDDEVKSGRTFDKPGIVAMANRGPNTNGAQFFITVGTPAHLNGHYSIFGEVLSGYEVVEAIANVPRGPMDRPTTEVRITKVTISDKAPKGAKGAK